VANENYEEIMEAIIDTADYYSDITGRNIVLGLNADYDVWLDTNRTNGREYFDSLEEAERRIKLLYDDLLPDEDEIDPLEGF